MGIAYRSDGPSGISVSVWEDDVTWDQAAAHVRELADLPEWGAGGRILTDLSYVAADSRPDAEQVRELAKRFEEHLDGRTRAAKWAVVANLTFDQATQFGQQIRGDVRSLIVFFDLASACIWLGVDVDAVRECVEELRQEARRAD